ncbi:MAG: transglutaminase domain-containing protein [Phycisphaerales bacterium]|nr:transglutaminase domain-containing protein [Phycisphaerales bacterium]
MRPRWRRPIKAAIVALTVFLICWPYPSRLILHLRHCRDLNALIEPDAPGLSPYFDELRPKLVDVDAGQDALKIVEKFVYQKVPYAWDWDNWGVVDYLPTVDEVLTAGREDCDGRAVLAASLLRGLGYQADLVTDAVHMWVKTDRGETMSPGAMGTFVESSDAGVVIRWQALTNIPKAFAYGIAVFPLIRELIVVAVIWILTLRRRIRWRVIGLALLVFVDGLLILRLAGSNPWNPNAAGQWFATANLLFALFLLHRAGRGSSTTTPAASA